MKLRKRQVAWLVVAILILGVGIGATVIHQRAKRAVADYQKQLVATGEKLTVEELNPKTVSPDENGVSNFFRAIPLMRVRQEVLNTNPPSGMTMVAPGKARVGWAQPNIRSSEGTNTWAEVITAVNNLSAALAELEELIDRPHLDFGVNYQMGFTMPLPNLAQTKQAAQKLYYAALCDLHRGDTASATIRLRSLLALAHGSADDRLVISQLVRIAITAIAVSSTWELLQSSDATEEQLALLQADWARLEFTLPAENALAMERAMSLMTVEQMRDSSAEFRKIAAGYSWPAAATVPTTGDWLAQIGHFGKDAWNKTRLTAKEAAWRYSWSYTDQLRTLKGNQALIECLRRARTNGNFGAALRSQEAKLHALGFDSIESDDLFGGLTADLDFRSLFSQGILALTKFSNKVMSIETSQSMVVTAIALQRYKLRHGSYPANLTALVPDYLPDTPRDPVNGEVLHYRSNPNGTFLLYSLGEDGDDNGGDPKPAKPESKSFYWQRGRDWVWPQTATPSEIEDFFRERQK